MRACSDGSLWMGFNPHPVRRPDETNHDLAVVSLFVVSIYIRSEDRMRHAGAFSASVGTDVSIHIRSEDRMRHHVLSSTCPPQASFNPHPVRRPDETLPVERQDISRSVSIHIRSEDRMRRGKGISCHQPTEGFNPHPVRRPDETAS